MHWLWCWVPRLVFCSESRMFLPRHSIRSFRFCGRFPHWHGCRLVWCYFLSFGKQASEMGALFTIAVCAMWPTVLNTAVGVRAVPQDYLNVARVLRLSRSQTLFKILIPATLPYMFTGFRLSLGIAWLVIVAAEMLTGRPGLCG